MASHLSQYHTYQLNIRLPLSSGGHTYGGTLKHAVLTRKSLQNFGTSYIFAALRTSYCSVRVVLAAALVLPQNEEKSRYSKKTSSRRINKNEQESVSCDFGFLHTP